MHASSAIAALVARVLLILIFLHSAWSMVRGPQGTAAYMTAHGMPAAVFFLVGAAALLWLGSLSVLLGLWTRAGAGMLVVFLVPTTLIFHNVFKEGGEMIQFLKNLGLLGGLVQLWLHGPGPISLDARRSRGPRPGSSARAA